MGCVAGIQRSGKIQDGAKGFQNDASTCVEVKEVIERLIKRIYTNVTYGCARVNNFQDRFV